MIASFCGFAPWVVSLGVWLIAVFACAGLSGEGRRPATFAIATFGLLAPLWFPERWVLARFIFTAAGVLVWFRTIDLNLRSPPLAWPTRLWFLIALFDVRRARRVAPRLDIRELRWLVGHAILTAICVFATVRIAPELGGSLKWLVRWAFGAGLCYAVVEVLHSSLLLGYLRGGVELPRINDFPLRSTTLAEFWGRRWNRVVAGWLRDYLFYPLARRRAPTLGVCAAFAGSTAIHFWLAWVPLDLGGGLLMASFFVVQAGALLLERRLAVASWPSARRRGWTIAWLLLSSPLFVEPALRIYLGSR